MRTRGLAALALSGAVVLGTASPSFAAPCPSGTYPPGADCTVAAAGALSSQVLQRGQDVAFTVSGFAASSDVRIQLHSTTVELGTFATDESGATNGTITVPSDAAYGAHTVTFGGTDAAGDARVLSVSVRVVPAAAVVQGPPQGQQQGGTSSSSSSSSDTLPLTGTQIAIGTGVGIVLLGAGAMMLLGARRRRTAADPVEVPELV